jgi:uncharacterized repeat protein (TIGR01451 family)
MKRILLGFAVLTGAVTSGAAGVYYFRPLISPAPAAGPEAQAATTTSAEPTPIRLSMPPRQDTAGNPFAAEPQAVVRVDRYADDIPPAGDVALEATEVPATRAANPFAAGGAAAENSRYPERTTAAYEAESAVEEAAAVDVEPRRLETPARAGRAELSAPQAVDDRYAQPAADEPQPATEPAAEPAADVPAEPAPAEEAPLEAAPAEAEPVAEPAAPDAQEEQPTVEGTGRPGDPQLNGSQAPTLTIEKTAPPEIQIGKAAKFTIKVRNSGTVPAHGVEVHDTVPQGTQLVATTPAAQSDAQGALVWDLNTLKPGDEQTIELELMPMSEGEVGSVATVHFRAEASVRTVATKPMLNMEVFSPSRVMKGETLTIKIKLSNPGTGAASGVLLSEIVPDGLKHEAGRELEFEVGTLKPGEMRELELQLSAAEAGTITNVVTARGEGNLEAEGRADVEVVAPQLQVSLAGPKRRYLERHATHNISVSNPGTAAAREIELAATLPKELKFVEANNGGQYDAATHSVYWSLEELPPQETGTVTLTTLPQQPGDAKLLITSTAQAGLKDQREETVAIEGLAAINFQLADVNDPVEAGGQTSYEIRVTNQGSKAAANIRVVAVAPAEMKLISAEGPVRYQIEGQRIVFEPLKQLGPKSDASFTVKVKALEPGDLRMQVQIATDEIREPITKEESTRVYGDE